MKTRHSFRRILAAGVLCFVGFAPRAAAQRSPAPVTTPKWEIEVHAGGGAHRMPDGGTASTVPASGSFQTFANRPSLRIPSWYFGDGSQLFNSLPTGARLGTTITPLDPTLYVGGEGRAGSVGGARLARALTPTFTAEFTIEYASQTSTLPEVARANAEESSASFESAFSAFLTSPGVPFVFSSVASTADVVERGNGQVLTLGALRVRLRPGRWSPFISAGGGVATVVGDVPQVLVRGRYEAQFVTGTTFRETDEVTVSYELPDAIPIYTVGGGFTYDVTPRAGLRFDVRALFGRATATTRVHTAPDVAQLLPPAVLAFQPAVGYGVQFSNNVAITVQESTLSSVNRDWETFQASGTQRRIDVSAGWYWRF